MTAVAIAGKVEVGQSTMDYELDVSTGEHLSIVGPNGAGKSTLLRAVAGLTRLSSGHVAVNGDVVDSPADNIFVPAHQRGVTLQPQSGALFGHLDVIDNVAFGLRNRGHRRAAARRVAAEILTRLDILDLAGRTVADLSGGEASKVALARSLAAEPAILLLDEPAAALDVQARADLRHNLRDLETTLITVTHDPVEALLLGERVAVVDNGRVCQAGNPDDVASNPATPWVAGFMGVNVVTGSADGDSVQLHTGATVRLAELAEGDVHLTFPANAVTLHQEEPHGSARNVWRVEIVGLTVEDGRVRAAFTGPLDGAALITRGAADELHLRPGGTCWASVKATEVRVLPA